MKRAFGFLLLIAVAFALIPPAKNLFAQFGSQGGWASGPSTGSANAQSVPIANYSLAVGVDVTFIVGAGLNNTGATTLNLNGTGSVALKRSTNVGTYDAVGGELIAGNPVTVVYDGTQYRLKGIIYQVGLPAMFRGTVDQGYVVEDGTCYSSTLPIYAALFAKIGTVYGSCGANTFSVPDTRGRIDAGLDNQGANGQAFRITNCTFTTFGQSCGNQNSTLTSTNQMPPYTPSGTTTFTPTGTISISGGTVGGQSPGTLDTGGTAAPVNTAAIAATFHGDAISPALAGTAVGISAPIPTISPVFAGIRAIKL